MSVTNKCIKCDKMLTITYERYDTTVENGVELVTRCSEGSKIYKPFYELCFYICDQCFVTLIKNIQYR